MLCVPFIYFWHLHVVKDETNMITDRTGDARQTDKKTLHEDFCVYVVSDANTASGAITAQLYQSKQTKALTLTISPTII